MHVGRALLLLAASSAVVGLPSAGRGADRLILRNLDILTDRTVTAQDEDGVVLDAPRAGGTNRIPWDEIERGRVALDQPRFDRLLGELGLPLFRIRQRLRTGDYAALAEPAEQMYPRFAARRSQTSYLVCQATMWSRLARGEREAAVEPYLRCFDLLLARAATSGALPGARRLQTDVATALSPELAPVWFDAVAAKAALPGLQETIRQLPQPRPAGAYIYYASLALAAGESAEAERVLGTLPPDEEPLASWRLLLEAQREVLTRAPGAAVEQVRVESAAWDDERRPAALYWLGLADRQSADEGRQRDGLVALLTLPAVYAAEQPELAAAGLYEAAEGLDKLKDASGAAAVRRALASDFAGTYYGRARRTAVTR